MVLLSENDIESYLRAGRIACVIRKEIEKYVKVGTKVFDIAEFIEKRIRELGGEPAFPVNISINDIAAHYTPIPKDTLVVPEDSVVKIDIGVHVNGFIADTATTIAFSDSYRGLVEAARHALEKALTSIYPGKKFSEVGAIIEKIIRDHGFKPVYNLSGHRIDRYTIHAGETIPNFSDRLNFGKFQLGRVYALEPFATNGSGFVIDSTNVTIYALRYNPKRIRELSKEAHSFYMYVYDSRRSLPFAKRWYISMFDEEVLNRVLKELASKNLLISYPVLVEKSRGIVTQFEHTILIDNKGNVIITTDGC